ncbi:galectin-8-like isoform X1 [Choristoneura fumiferana]|uniref:galectin-8-like isoform X1 n=1 Tax=Choristoneura fumiferana TaxID=7141 RepID=UPI003D15EDA3
MPVDSLKCVNCITMEYNIDEGYKPSEFDKFDDYDFAEDAFDFECQLADARDVKFNQTLTEPLVIGSHILCTGTPTEDLPWFALNIGTGDPISRTAEVAVHFNVRVPQCYVVRNTRHHEKWGPEETTAFKSFPFKMGRPFTIEVLVDETETMWAVDGEHYCNFTHRNPSPLVATWVQVTGVRDATLNIQKTELYPMLAPPPVEVPIRDSLDALAMDSEPSWRPNITALLTKGIPPGHQLVIHGRLRPLLHSFTINIQDAAREWPVPNVIVHVNVRAHDESHRERQLVVLNSRLGGWGEERRQRTATLVPGTQSTFRIVHGPGEWAVFANDVLIGELEHRAAPALARALRLRGDLFPERIYVCPSSQSPTVEDCKGVSEC